MFRSAGPTAWDASYRPTSPSRVAIHPDRSDSFSGGFFGASSRSTGWRSRNGFEARDRRVDRNAQPGCREADAGRCRSHVLSAICWHQRLDLLQASTSVPVQQTILSDYSVLFPFSPTLFETLGLDYEMRLTLSGLMNVIQLIAVLFSLVMFEKLGRKTWLYIGSVGMTTSHIVVAAMIGMSTS